MSLLLDELEHLLTNVTDMKTNTSIMNTVIANVVENMAHPHSSQVCFRASSIGKPWILQVLGRWYPHESAFSVGTCMKMLDGIVTQAWAEEIIRMGGYSFESERTLELQVGQTKVMGHSDIVVTNHATRQIVVIECKSMAAHIITKFFANPHDDHGYISQLAFYTEMVKRAHPTYTVTPTFLLYDRSNGKYKVCGITTHVLDQKFQRVEQALGAVAAIPTFDLDALLDTVKAPPPMDGVPPSMRWSIWAKAFYYSEGKDTKMHSRDTCKQLIQNISQSMIGGGL